MCGIVGMVGTAPVNQDIYDALLLLQHRGQDATGIATAEPNGVMHNAKAQGMVREAFRTRDAERAVEVMRGHSAMPIEMTKPEERGTG